MRCFTARLAAVGTALVLAAAAHLPAVAAGLGVTQLPPQGDDEPVTVYHPTRSPAGPLRHGWITLLAADNGTPERGNGRLVVVSHGTGGGHFAHTELARALVEAGFTVAMPLHKHDHWRDHRPGTMDSPKRRAQEVSRAIDAVARDARFAPLLALDKVGVFGFSAGGFTALALAGGRWSPQRFVQHCDTHLADDWYFCTGVITRLTGGWLDGLKRWVARHEIRRRFADDEVSYGHTDARIAAIVAAAPAAAMFDMASLARPVAPLGLVTLGQDRWLQPRFHSEAVLAACAPCERVAELPTAGHGAMLAPLPPGLDGVLGELLNDPAGFKREALLPQANRRIAAYFARHLPAALAAGPMLTGAEGVAAAAPRRP